MRDGSVSHSFPTEPDAVLGHLMPALNPYSAFADGGAQDGDGQFAAHSTMKRNSHPDNASRALRPIWPILFVATAGTCWRVRHNTLILFSGFDVATKQFLPPRDRSPRCPKRPSWGSISQPSSARTLLPHLMVARYSWPSPKGDSASPARLPRCSPIHGFPGITDSVVYSLRVCVYSPSPVAMRTAGISTTAYRSRLQTGRRSQPAIDDTVDIGHSTQQLSLIDTRHDECSVRPIHLYDAATVRPVAVRQRSGEVRAGREGWPTRCPTAPASID
jgi:hypothetical protein